MYGTALNNHRPKGDTASAARLKNTKKKATNSHELAASDKINKNLKPKIIN
jgi:hypothetical protein